MRILKATRPNVRVLRINSSKLSTGNSATYPKQARKRRTTPYNKGSWKQSIINNKAAGTASERGSCIQNIPEVECKLLTRAELPAVTKPEIVYLKRRIILPEIIAFHTKAICALVVR